MYRTPALATYVTFELVIATVFCLASLPGLNKAFNLTDLPVEYRAKVFLLACCYSAAALLYERFCVPHVSDDEGEGGGGEERRGEERRGEERREGGRALLTSRGTPPRISSHLVSSHLDTFTPHTTHQSPCRPRWWGPSPFSARGKRRRRRRRQGRGPAQPQPTTRMPRAFIISMHTILYSVCA